LFTSHSGCDIVGHYSLSAVSDLCHAHRWQRAMFTCLWVKPHVRDNRKNSLDGQLFLAHGYLTEV